MNDALLTDFATSFFGYGTLDAPVWFVGMEEGGGASEAEISSRLSSWESHDRTTVVDIRSFGEVAEIDEHSKWFVERPRLQSTWKQLIRLQLARMGRATDTESVRQYQRDEFAAATGNECLLELLPLPSPSVSKWSYATWSELPWLVSREAYRAHLMEGRIASLRTLIQSYAPSAVIFYSLSYSEYWESVAREPAWETEGSIRYADDGVTQYVIAPHPVAHGTTNLMFEELGRRIDSR